MPIPNLNVFTPEEIAQAIRRQSPAKIKATLVALWPMLSADVKRRLALTLAALPDVAGSVVGKAAERAAAGVVRDILNPPKGGGRQP